MRICRRSVIVFFSIMCVYSVDVHHLSDTFLLVSHIYLWNYKMSILCSVCQWSQWMYSSIITFLSARFLKIISHMHVHDYSQITCHLPFKPRNPHLSCKALSSSRVFHKMTAFFPHILDRVSVLYPLPFWIDKIIFVCLLLSGSGLWKKSEMWYIGFTMRREHVFFYDLS